MLLLTAFGPFLEVKENPSQVLLEAVGAEHTILPVSYQKVEAFLRGLDGEFDSLLMVGVHGRTSRMRWEHRGKNVIGLTPDMDGVARAGSIQPKGPTTRRSTLKMPVPTSKGVMRGFDAGTYLCNFSLYTALGLWPDKKVGFLHIPSFEQMPLETQKRNMVAILDALNAG